jgi:hypothetical protein
MFNNTLKKIAGLVQENLFNPDQPGSPQPWNVPEDQVYDIDETPDTGKTPRVVFSPGSLETDPENKQTFEGQPELKTVTEEILPPDHSFAQTYILQHKPVKPVIKVQAHLTDGTKQTMDETDDFLVDYKKGEITFREEVQNISKFEITFQTNQVAGPAATINLVRFFSIQVTAGDVMAVEAISAIIIGTIETFKEDILSEPENTYNSPNVTSRLKPIDIQLINKPDEPFAPGGKSVTLNYQVPGMIRIARKIPPGKLGIIKKIFHPEAIASDKDVVVKVDRSDNYKL